MSTGQSLWRKVRDGWRKLSGWPLVVIAVVVFTSWSMLVRNRNFDPVTGYDNVLSLLDGNTLIGRKFSIYYHGDGRMVGKAGSYYDTGYWVARDDGYCENWLTWGNAEILCWTIQSNANRILREGQLAPRYLDDVVSNRLTLHPGNAMDLVIGVRPRKEKESPL